MHLPPAFEQIVGAPLQGVARLTVIHVERREFRWMSLVELTVGLLLFVCALPLILVLVAISALEGDGPWDGMGDGGGAEASRGGRSRFFRFHHDVLFEGWNAQGGRLFSARHTPVTEADGERLVAAVLQAANRDGIVVYELVRAGGITEPVEVWFGGHPLLALPANVEPSALRREVEAGGIEVHEDADVLALRRAAEPTPQWVGVVTMVLRALISPLLVMSASGRQALHDGWLDAQGAPPATRTIQIGPDGLRSFEERSGVRRDEAHLSSHELVGITYSAALGYDPVERRPESLRALGRSRSLTLSLGKANGHAVRALLVGRVLRLLAHAGHAAPTHCPFCGTLYQMGPNTRCPHCGAPTGQVRQSAGALSRSLAG